MIPHELVKINANLPAKLSELAIYDHDKAIELLKAWANGSKTLRVLWDEVNNEIERAIK